MNDGVNIRQHRLLGDRQFPNNARLPLLLYPQAVDTGQAGDPAVVFEKLFRQHDWGNAWRNGIYSYHHYHSTAHEALGVYRGRAVVQFGGEQGVTVSIQTGDVVVIPAGVAHKRLSSSSDFAVVGAYPSGQRWDMNYADASERPQADQNIAQVPLPSFDPVYGEAGLPEIWTQAE